MKFYFKKLLQNSGWLENVSVETDENGLITSIEENAESSKSFEGLAIPGFQNAHSHSFQYAMAGLAENHSTTEKQSDFWSWREAMYRLALDVNPDQFEAIARCFMRKCFATVIQMSPNFIIFITTKTANLTTISRKWERV